MAIHNTHIEGGGVLVLCWQGCLLGGGRICPPRISIMTNSLCTIASRLYF